MYNFTQPNGVHRNVSHSIKTSFKGVNLDNQLTGDGNRFQTLTVTGRGLSDYDTDSDSLPGVDGAFTHRSTVESREIVVKALIESDGNAGFRQLYRRLNKLLQSRQDHALRFTDESAHYFNARYVSGSKPDETSNSQVIELTFLCSNPYKFKNQETINASNAQVLNLDTDYPVRPDEIIIRFNSQADAREWVLNNTSNGGRIRFKLQSGSAASAVLRIVIKDNFIGFNDLNRITQGLDITYSNFRKFVIDDGDQLVITPAPESFDVKYKGVSL